MQNTGQGNLLRVFSYVKYRYKIRCSATGFTLMALTGQMDLHLPQPMHKLVSNCGNPPLFKLTACLGQASTHEPQPMQISSSV